MNSYIKKKILLIFYFFSGEKLFLIIRYYLRTGKLLSFKNPKSFTEKLQFLKLYDRRSIYTECADKIVVKDRVISILGEKFVIPTLKVLHSPTELTASNISNLSVIIKTNHDSGGTKVLKDSTSKDFIALQSHFKRKLKNNFYYSNLEWEYKNIEPKILIEPLISDNTGNALLNDYKIHCFHGEPHFIQMINDRAEGVKETWYDTDWNYINMWYFSSKHKLLQRPSTLSQMLLIAKELSKPFPYVRIDLYDTPDGILFGEYTFRPWGGYMRWNDDNWDIKLGNLIDLNRLSEYE